MKTPLIIWAWPIISLSFISIILDNENALVETVEENSEKFMLIKTPDIRKTPNLVLVEKSNGLKSLLKVDPKTANQKIVRNSTDSSNPIRPRSDTDMIDSDHLNLYPYCGSMNYKGNNQAASGRVVNSKTPADVYRWTVLLEELTYQKYKRYCTGTIITDSHVLTAGHCICDPETTKTNVKCLPATENQLNDDNQLTAYGGSDKWPEVIKSTKYSWKMDFAYIMNADLDAQDIGIAGLDATNKKKFFNKKELLIKNNLKAAKIVPLCLGKQGLERAITHNDIIKGAGWGETYQEAPEAKDLPSGQRKPVFSSCMTSEASPDMWRFQNCDLDRLGKNFECIKNIDPPDYKPDQKKKCERIFKKAKTIKDKDSRSKTIKEKLSKVDKFYLSNTLNKNEKFNDLKDPEVCYNPKKLSTIGWCYLKDFPEKWEAESRGKTWNREAWGVCSPSCDTTFKQNVIDKKEKTVQEIKWRNHDNHKWLSLCNDMVSWFNPKKLYCMENELPSTKIMVFKKKGEDGIHVDDYDEKEIPIKLVEQRSYLDACAGDSGSSQFISNKVDYNQQNLDRFKFVQVAIAIGQVGSPFKHAGKHFSVPCGTFSYDVEKSRDKNAGRNHWSYREYFSSVAMALKTTEVSNLKWIKNTAKI